MADSAQFAPPPEPAAPTPVVDANNTRAGLAHDILATSGMFRDDGSLDAPQRPAPAPAPAPSVLPPPPAAQAPQAMQSPAAVSSVSLLAQALARQAAPVEAPPAQASVGDAPKPDTPEPAPEAATVPLGEEPPKPGDPRARHAWAQARAEAKQAREEAAKERQEREAYASKLAEMAKEVEERNTALQELEDRLGRTNLEQSPSFQQKYQAQFSAIASRVARTIETYGGMEKAEAESIARDLLFAKPSEVAALAKKLDPSVAGAVISASAEAQAIAEQREQELLSWREATASRAADEARRDMVAEVQERRAMADEAIEKVLAQGIVAYDVKNPGTAEIANKAIETFQGFAQTATADQLMELAAAGHVLPVYQQLVSEQVAKISELENVIASRGYAMSFPGSAPRQPAAAPDALTAIKDPTAFADTALSNILGDMRQFARR